MSSACPVCRRLADALVRGVHLAEVERGLIQRLNPAWVDPDGLCPRCLDAIRESARRLNEHSAKPSSADGFRGYARFYLNRRESGQWHHINAEIGRWRQRQIIDRASADAEREGHEAWALFDADEKLIAQGPTVND